MKSKLKSVIKNLNPKILGVDKINISSFRKLGIGEGNIHYVFSINKKKFVCRVRIDSLFSSKEEYNSLKIIEGLHISPRPYYYHAPSQEFPFGFIILDFVEGKPLAKKGLNFNQIKQLALILANLHSKKCEGLAKKDYSFKQYLSECKRYNSKISKNNNKLKKELGGLYQKINHSLPKKEEHKFSLIHGDVCPENIIQTSSGLKLVDWETLRCADPAEDIASILIDLELKKKNLDLFLQEYSKIRKDLSLLKRAAYYTLLLRYRLFLWEIVRSIEIANKNLPKEYLSKTTVQTHIKNAKVQLKELGKLIEVPKINLDNLSLTSLNS